ncbi:MAG: PEP-CTERM sorting domain-containing protein [Cyanobacteria bacterium P01_C01_bin.70]
MNNTTKFGLLSTTALATVASAGALWASPAEAVTFELKGNSCLTGKCVDLGSAGFNVEGGAITDIDIPSRAKTPGSDINAPAGDFVDDSDSVLSYNVTSAENIPSGAIDPINVSNLDGVFEFFWGSVDTFNIIEFFKGDDLVATFTGADIANEAGVGGSANSSGGFNFDAFVNFMGDFDSAKLFNDFTGDAPRETRVAFEVAAAVPEPASLLGLASVGLLFGGSLVSRKKQHA